jgi:hypothetical protein
MVAPIAFVRVETSVTVPSSKLLISATVAGARHIASAAGVGAAQTPCWQISSPLHVSPSEHGVPSCAASQAFEQQSPSTALPSSHCSLVWLTRPSPQTGGAVVLVVLVVLVVVVLVVVLLVVLDVVVLEVVVLEVVVLELVVLVVVLVVGKPVTTSDVLMKRATKRPKASAPCPIRSVAKGAHTSAVTEEPRAKRTRLPPTKNRTPSPAPVPPWATVLNPSATSPTTFATADPSNLRCALRPTRRLQKV